MLLTSRRYWIINEEGVLILASGNIAHNLRKINWREPLAAFDWAKSFDSSIRDILLARDFGRLQDFSGFAPSEVADSVPTPEHYLPLLYAAAASDEKDKISFPFEEMQNGTISMRSVKFGGT